MIKWKGFAYCPLAFCYDRGWYFWNEIWNDIIGPFHSHIEAASQLLQYYEELNYTKENRYYAN